MFKLKLIMHTPNPTLLVCACTGPETLVVYLLLATDPFQPYKDDKKFSVTPFVMTTANVPYRLRWKHGLSTTLALLEGSSDRTLKVNR